MFEKSFDRAGNAGPPTESESGRRAAGASVRADGARASPGRTLHEKRVLISRSEEAELESLVKLLGEVLGTHVKASHVLRALITLVLRNRRAVLRGAMAAAGTLRRPRNGDFSALVRFESELAGIIVRALVPAAAGGGDHLTASDPAR